MASRSEEVFILLKAIGAAAARRQIDSVADALGRLNSETGDHTEIAKDETIAVEKVTAAQKKNTEATKDATKVNQKFVQEQKIMVQGLQRYARGEVGLTKSRLEQYKQRAKIDAMVKRANDQVLKDQMRNQREEARLDKLHAAERLKVRNQTLREEAKLERQAEAERKRAMRQEERDMKAQEKLLKNHLTIRQRIANKIRNFKMPASAGFNSPIRVAAISTLVFSLLDVIPFLATGLNVVGAAGIAAANGLAPLAGMLVALPMSMLAIKQASVVTKIALMGMKEAIGGDDKALDKLPENARQFALAARILKTTYEPLRRSIQNSLFKGMGDEVLLLGNTYLPVLNNHLGDTARHLNQITLETSKWLRGNEGLGVMNSLMATNSYVVDRGSDALFRFFKGFLRIGTYAGPMMRSLSDDVLQTSNRFNNWTRTSDKEITGFFNRSYRLFKRSLGVLGDFGGGMINIFRLSAPLSESIGNSVEKAAENFRKWTESEKGIEAIKNYFTEMEPNIRSVAKLLGAVGKAIFDIGRSPNFGKTVDQIRTELLPSLVEIFKAADGKFIPALIKIVKGVEILAQSGVIDIIADVLETAADAFLKVANWFSGLPQWTKDFIIWGLVLYGIFAKPIGAAIKLVGWIAKIAGALKGIKLGAGLAALMQGGGLAGAAAAAARGGAGGAVVAGGGAAAAKPASRGAKVAAGAGKVAGAATIVVSGAMLMQPLMDWINKVGGGSDKASNAAGAAKSGNTADILKDASGKPLVGGLGYKDITSLDQALQKLGSNNVFTKFNNWMAKFNGHVGPVDKLRNAFKAYDDQLHKLPIDKAQNGFDRIYQAAVRQKFPMDKLIQMFPQYAQKVSQSGERAKIMGSNLYTAADKAQLMAGRLNGIKIPAGEAGEAMLRADQKAREVSAGMSGASGNASRLAGNFARAGNAADSARGKITLLGRAISNLDLGAIQRANRSQRGGITANFAGGTVMPGELSLTGELGPEATITRTGKIGIVGLHGPELFKPGSETAVIPSGATFNPGGASFGGAPDWAKNAFQNAMSSGGTKVKAIPQSSNKDRDKIVLPTIQVTGNNFSQNVDIEEALYDAYKKMIRDMEERR